MPLLDRATIERAIELRERAIELLNERLAAASERVERSSSALLSCISLHN